MPSAMETARDAEWLKWGAHNPGQTMGQHLQGFEYGFELGWAAGRASALAQIHTVVGPQDLVLAEDEPDAER